MPRKERESHVRVVVWFHTIWYHHCREALTFLFLDYDARIEMAPGEQGCFSLSWLEPVFSRGYW